jgi:enamine deaminase RidA (YjgF/YER057c/UK114 family)
MKRIPGVVPTRSKAVISNGHVFLNVAPVNKAPSTLTQTTDALNILDARLEEVGSNKSKIVSVSVFVANIKNKDEVNEAWDAWVDRDNPPIRACLGSQLEGLDLVELSVVASV